MPAQPTDKNRPTIAACTASLRRARRRVRRSCAGPASAPANADVSEQTSNMRGADFRMRKLGDHGVLPAHHQAQRPGRHMCRLAIRLAPPDRPTNQTTASAPPWISKASAYSWRTRRRAHCTHSAQQALPSTKQAIEISVERPGELAQRQRISQAGHHAGHVGYIDAPPENRWRWQRRQSGQHAAQLQIGGWRGGDG